MDILSLFACFELLLPKVAVRQLASIAQAILTLTGRISMLGISRWAEKGGSYRTIQRFFQPCCLGTRCLPGFLKRTSSIPHTNIFWRVMKLS